MQQSIPQGEIFYHANRRREVVPFTPELRVRTEGAIAAALSAIHQPMPAPINHRKKCQACSLQTLCLPFEIQQLQQEVSP